MYIPRVAIIILNWNRWKDTLECLESVYQNSYTKFDVIIVDNGSTDGSIQRIKEYCVGEQWIYSKYFQYNQDNKPLSYVEFERNNLELNDYKVDVEEKAGKTPLIIIRNEENIGYAGGVNTGIKFSLNSLKPDFILLLNNDIVVDRDFLNELIISAENNPKNGISGPKIYYYDYKGRSDVINFAGGNLNLWVGLSWHTGLNNIDRGQYNNERQVNYIEGSCLLARVDMIKSIGLLDPDYFAYWEEADWCFRAKKQGWLSVYSPKAKIWHRVSASGGGKTNPISEYYMTRNSFIFMKMNATPLQQFTFLGSFLVGMLPLKVVKYLLLSRNTALLGALKRGTLDGIRVFMQ